MKSGWLRAGRVEGAASSAEERDTTLAPVLGTQSVPTIEFSLSADFGGRDVLSLVLGRFSQQVERRSKFRILIDFT